MAMSKVKDSKSKPDDPNSRKVKQLFLESVAAEEGFEGLYSHKSSVSAASSSFASPDSSAQDATDETPLTFSLANTSSAVKRTPAKSSGRKPRSAFFPAGMEEVKDEASMLLNLASPRHSDVIAALTADGGFAGSSVASELVRLSATPKEDCDAATALIALNSPTSQHAASLFSTDVMLPMDTGCWEEVVLQNPPSLGKRRKMQAAAKEHENSDSNLLVKRARMSDAQKLSCVTPLPIMVEGINAELTDLSSSSLSPVNVHNPTPSFHLPRPSRSRGLSVLNEVLFPADPCIAPQKELSSEPKPVESRSASDTERESPYSVNTSTSLSASQPDEARSHPLLAAKKLRKQSAPAN